MVIKDLNLRCCEVFVVIKCVTSYAVSILLCTALKAAFTVESPFGSFGGLDSHSWTLLALTKYAAIELKFDMSKSDCFSMYAFCCFESTQHLVAYVSYNLLRYDLHIKCI